MVEKLCKLLFELSSPERMNILLEIQRQGLKLSHISQKLDLTVPEASRHLQRLSEAKLVGKNVDGLFELTALGNLVLSLLSSLKFVSENNQYFLGHLTSHIPIEFIGRLGELSSAGLGADVMTGFRIAEIMLQGAREYIWIMSDQILTNVAPVIVERAKGGVEFRFIFPEKLVPPPGVKPAPSAQRRTLPKVGAVILMTEKEAIFCLPDKEGRMDYSPLIGKGASFHQWCRDLFLHYWERATPGTTPYA